MDIIDLAITEQGFLINVAEWTETWAIAQAISNNINLSEVHWEIIYFMRSYYITYKHLPNARMFIKAIATQLGLEKGNSRYLHGLFHDTPLRTVCLLAGVPKPANCL